MPARRLTLEITDAQLHGLYLALDKGRGSTVKVDREALRTLLRDHGRLIGHYQITS